MEGKRVEKNFLGRDEKPHGCRVFITAPHQVMCACECEKYLVEEKRNWRWKKTGKNLFLHSCNDNIPFAIRSEAQLEHDENLHQPEKMLNKKIIRKYQAAQIRITNS